jgi:dihydropteroate synthase
MQVVAQHPACGLCLMHMHREPRSMQLLPMEGDVVPQVLLFLQRMAQDLQGRGVQRNRIVIDPGIGFGKTVAQNFALLARQNELLGAGYPLLLGWSRKSSLTALTGSSTNPVAGATDARLIPSVVAAMLALERGASIVRVHDVGPTVQAIKVLAAIR